MHYRCSYCQKRRTMSPPETYIRVPKCKGLGCDAKRLRLGKPIRYYRDRYREKHEVFPGAPRPCTCGYVYGKGGEYPHRKGSGTCLHNPANLPE